MGHFSPLRRPNQLRIFQVNASGFLVQSHALQRQMFILSLEPMIVFPQAAYQSSCYMLYFLLSEAMPEKPSLAELLSQVVVVLPFKNEVKVLLFRAVTRVIEMV